MSAESTFLPQTFPISTRPSPKKKDSRGTVYVYETSRAWSRADVTVYNK